MNFIKISILIVLWSLTQFSTSLAQDDKPIVVCSATIFKDMTHMIAQDLVEIETIVNVGGDPHIYEPTPKDAKLVAGADLILVNGLTFEGWIDELIENSGTAAKTVLITEGITPLSSTTYDNSTDPHAWMTAINGVKYLNNISKALITLDPDNAISYKENLAIAVKELVALDQEIKAKIKTIPSAKRVLITSHDAFQYFGKHYGIRLEALMGISTDSEAQTSDITRVIKIIEQSKIPAIFVESTINPKTLKQIAEDSDVAIGGELYADSLGEEGGEAGTYVDMLRHNTETIVNALAHDSFAATKIDEEAKLPSWLLYGILGLILILGLVFMIVKLK